MSDGWITLKTLIPPFWKATAHGMNTYHHRILFIFCCGITNLAIYQFTINTLITKAKADIETRIETVRTKLGLNNTDADQKIEELSAKIDALTAAVAKLAAKPAVKKA